MSDSMRQNLIGYLLQAIDPDEHSAVEEHLEKDPALRDDCELLRACLIPLSHDKEHHEPPKGLASRCCDFVYSRTEVMPVAVTAAGDGHQIGRRPWSWLDLSAAGAIAVAVAVLFVPAIFQSHVLAQRTACQNNLQEIGTAMSDYSSRHGGYYPLPNPDDNVHLASAWGPKLVNSLPRGEQTLMCPSDPSRVPNSHVPNIAELEAMNAAQLEERRDHLSGSYGATLGYQVGKKYTLPKHGSSQLAVASDRSGRNGTNSPNHNAEGQFVLFGDSHVAFITTPQLAGSDDNIFLNHRGQEAPGADDRDSVVTGKGLELRQIDDAP